MRIFRSDTHDDHGLIATAFVDRMPNDNSLLIHTQMPIALPKRIWLTRDRRVELEA